MSVAAFAQPTRGYPVVAARAALDDPEHYARLVSEFERISGQTDEMITSMFHLHAMLLTQAESCQRLVREDKRLAR